MKRQLWVLAIAAALSFMGSHAQAQVASGTDVDFQVSAGVPTASQVNVIAKQIDVTAGGDVWGATVSELDFNVGATNALKFNPVTGIWISDHYFAINIGLANGGGSLSTEVAYLNEVSPAGQTRGLGYKTTAKFVKVYIDDDDKEAEGDVDPRIVLLKDLAGGVTVPASAVAGGYLRIYVGIYDGSNDTLNDQLGEPFTNSDKPGPYSGTLRITATVS